MKRFDKLFYVFFSEMFANSPSNDLKLFCYIIRKMDIGNYVDIHYDYVAKNIGCHADTIRKITRDFVGRDFLRKAYGNTYMVNPTCIYRGREPYFYVLVDEYRKLQK